MADSDEFDSALLDEYIMLIRMEQLILGLQPKKFRQVVLYHHKFIETLPTVEEAICIVEEEINTYQDAVDLSIHVGGLHHSKGHKLPKQREERGDAPTVLGTPARSYEKCFNCNSTEHDLWDCPTMCKRCIPPCGKIFPQCPVYVDFKARKGTKEAIGLHKIYQIQHGDAKVSRRASTPVNLSPIDD